MIYSERENHSSRSVGSSLSARQLIELLYFLSYTHSKLISFGRLWKERATLVVVRFSSAVSRAVEGHSCLSAAILVVGLLKRMLLFVGKQTGVVKSYDENGLNCFGIDSNEKFSNSVGNQSQDPEN